MHPRMVDLVKVLLWRRQLVDRRLLFYSDQSHRLEVPYRLCSNIFLNRHSFKMVLFDYNSRTFINMTLMKKQQFVRTSKTKSSNNLNGQTNGTEIVENVKVSVESARQKSAQVISASSTVNAPAMVSKPPPSTSTNTADIPSATKATTSADSPTIQKTLDMSCSRSETTLSTPCSSPSPKPKSASTSKTSPILPSVSSKSSVAEPLTEVETNESIATPTTTEPNLLASTETKKMEVKTSKGILSITTTVEDSKINEVIFEKTAIKPPKQLPTTAPVEVAKEIAKTDPEPKPKALETKAKAIAAAILKPDKPKVDLSKILKGVAPAEKMEIKPKPKRTMVDCNRSSMERNFVTPARAMSEFLLKASDLECLPKIKRRSPYEQEPPITVYWRRDVEAKAIEIWGSRENLLKETLKRDIERKKHQQNLFTVKRRLRDYRREIGARAKVYEDAGLKGQSGKVVLIAIGINGLNFLFKACTWLFTGSHSMFAEAIHSLADTVNQMILAYGIHKSTQEADPDHPYGYTNMKHVSSLISGVGIFCVGAGLSIYHGITGILHPEPITDLYWAFYILGGSLVSEGATLLVAMNKINRSAKAEGISFKEYVLTSKDPCVNVVLTEDAVAVVSVMLAASCMGLSTFTGSPIFDAVGSLLIGGILGGVASFIIYTNVAALVGRSIPYEKLRLINAELENDVMIRAIHDVKGIDMGNSLVRYKAEMDFDGRELTRSYLDKQELNELLKVVKSFQTVEQLEEFLLNHGENIVDLMGGEIDRIEMKLRKKFPEIRHCDLEIL